ncbi:DUF4401 domain-containing protein [Shewanella sp. OMA3-2]|uniref:DUF4401 domain-containing protein n=1 Tax=Shewanella sp. OMA3-2 TaxID=2908650 RepID=UPI001F1AE94A|nr:DUF4401 domain-containing protein [Shewanella sp. OMA3-2]UJF22802.1 DUF4401 domain-containing protein [Shewanella sp. OMA3-2]
MSNFNARGDLNTEANLNIKGKLWQSLFDQALVSTDSPPATVLTNPWYMMVAQMIGGWVAALFLLACVLVSGSIIGDINESFIGFGAALMLGCLLYYRLSDNRQEFVVQMMFAFSLCGQIMWLLGVYDSLESHNDTLVALIYVLTFAIHWAVIPHRTNQFVAAFGMVPSLLAILVLNQLSLLVLPILVLSIISIWTQMYRWPWHYQRLRMLGYAIAINILMVNLSLTGLGQIMDLPIVLMALDSNLSHYIAITITLLSALWLMNNIINSLNRDINNHKTLAPLTRTTLMIILSAILISLLSIVMSGLSTALLMLLLGYFYNERKLIMLSVCALLAFIGLYYYSLHIDLFEKSMWLIASGVMLLLMRLVIGMKITIGVKTRTTSKELSE